MKLNRLKVGLVTLAALTSFIGCSINTNALRTGLENDKKWKVSAYLDGDSNTDIPTFWSFNKLEKVGSNKMLNIYAQLDRFEDENKTVYEPLLIDSTFGTRRYHVQKDENMRKINSKEIFEFGNKELNMGAYKTFDDFIKWVESHDSGKHVFIIKGHGYGIMVPLTQIMSTKEYDAEDDALPTYTISKVFDEKLKKKLEVIVFDSCEKATIEVAYQLRKHAKVMVASEDLIHYHTSFGEEGAESPSSGMEYDEVLKFITKNPGADAKKLGRFVFDSYFGALKDNPHTEKTPATLSVIDLETVEGFVEKFSKFSNLLIERLTDEKARDKTMDSLKQALKKAQRYDPPDSLIYTHVDLFDFLKKLAQYSDDEELKDSSKSVKKSDIIIKSSYKGKDVKGSKGVSILFIEDFNKLEYMCGTKRYAEEIISEVKKYYSKSDFAKKTGWDRVMDLYQEYSKKQN